MIIPALEIVQKPEFIRARYNVTYSRNIPALNSLQPGTYTPTAPLVAPLELSLPNVSAKSSRIYYQVNTGIYCLNTVTGANILLRSELVQSEFGTSAGGDKISVNGTEYIEVIQMHRGARFLDGPIKTFVLNNIWVTQNVPVTDLAANALVALNPATAVGYLSLDILVMQFM